jgi:hypothetical protein
MKFLFNYINKIFQGDKMNNIKMFRINKFDMPYLISYSLVIIMATLALVFLSSCSDTAPVDYIPANFVEGFLIVNEPIKDIKIIRSQPINQTYDLSKSLIRDAQVKISGDGKEIFLTIDPMGDSGYYNIDRSYLIKPDTKYTLEVRLHDGTVITGETTTPQTTQWVNRVDKQIQYPTDSLNLPASKSVSWNHVDTVHFYFIQYVPLDTLNYGKYLEPKTNELNRRVYKSHEDENWLNEMATGHLVANTETSVIWSIFKWYGKYQITLYVPDANMLKAGMQNGMFNTYDPLLSSVKGAYGFFGSSSVIRDTTFLLKNQK